VLAAAVGTIRTMACASFTNPNDAFAARESVVNRFSPVPVRTDRGKSLFDLVPRLTQNPPIGPDRKRGCGRRQGVPSTLQAT
jgi:hypothetical protein